MEAAKRVDSFISYRPLPANFAFIQKYGIEEFAKQEKVRVDFLDHLLEHFDDGRSRSFYCIACQLISLEDLKSALAEAEAEMSKSTDIKEKAKLVRVAISHLAETLGINLKLRK